MQKSKLDDLSDYLLGFHPQDSRLEILSREEWQAFSLEHLLPEGVVGDFIPHEQTAYVLKAEEPEQTRRCAHEYVGHANFCEYNKVGREIVQLNKELISLETALLGRQFPKNKKVKLAIGKEKKIIENDALLIILPPEKEKIALEYSQKRCYSEQFFSQNYQLYEGFALWAESKTGTKIQPKREGYAGFLQINRLETQIDFLTKIGFLTQKNKKGVRKRC